MIPDDDDDPLVACCGCGCLARLRNIVMLPMKAPIAGRGWGCVVCGLASDGAVAVICDTCLETDAEILFACAGYAKDPGRIPVSALTEPHRHDETQHPREDFAGEELP